MVSFFVYDLAFLILFSIFIALFLYKRRRQLKREMGIMFLYKTKFGIKAINYVSDRFSRVWHVLKYFSIVSGFFLMAGILYLIGQAVYIYITFPQITKIIKAPPIAPLIPYFPKIFGLESFFPDFYFIYFIFALAIVAFVHEFSHGIYMRLFKIKIKATGVVALGPLLGAFVEEDKGQFEKRKRGEQMAVLSAGVFANIIVALIFFGLMVGFFNVSFAEGGYHVKTEACLIIAVELISGIGNGSDEFTEVYVGNVTYLLDERLKKQLDGNASHIVGCRDFPAFRAGLKGQVIVQANEIEIKNQEDFLVFLDTKSVGEQIQLKTLDGETKEQNIYDLELVEHPLNSEKATLGIPLVNRKGRGVIGSIILFFTDSRNPTTYYTPIWNGGLAWFIYYFFWWVALINFLVALFNMLPLGILDGGRFFYLTVLSITKSEKVAKVGFKIVSYLILLMFLTLMVAWALAI